MMQKGIQFSKRFWLIYSLAWIPYALTFAAVFLSQSPINFADLLTTVGRSVISAAILGVFVILVCNRIDWSYHRQIWFFPLHIFLSILYSFGWMFFLFFLISVSQFYQNGKWQFVFFTGYALQWQVFTGITIYATIVSIVYVLQVVQNLREEERRAARAETLYAQNSLAVLQAQLNPHFLFNTLHSLMALVRYDAEKAETAIEKLSEMLRYSLKDKGRSDKYLVRLEDELNFVENYLELEKMRLCERLTVRKNIENETLDCLIPAFTIQPLVENSIKHGIAPKNISAEISISIKRENENLKIEVADNGIGSENGNYQNSEGLGLKLVREQLQINYGEKSKFEIETNLNKGFKTKIEIPMSFAEKQIEK